MKFHNHNIGRRNRARVRADRLCPECGSQMYKSNIKIGVIICKECNFVAEEKVY